MGFRKDVRSFMRDVRDWMTQTSAAIALYQDVIERQKEEIRELRAAFLARDLPEMAQYREIVRTERETSFVPETAWSTNDEDLAGSIIQLEG